MSSEKEEIEETDIEKKEVIIKKKGLSNIILVVFILLAIFIAGIFIYNTQLKHKASISVPQTVVHNYTPLIDNWNRQVQYITDEKKFLLNRDTNENMIDQLNEFMKTFYIPNISNSVAYNTYLEENKIGELISFNTSMDRDKVKEILKKATRENAISDIVKKILMMNDIKLWLKNNKISEE